MISPETDDRPLGTLNTVFSKATQKNKFEKREMVFPGAEDERNPPTPRNPHRGTENWKYLFVGVRVSSLFFWASLFSLFFFVCWRWREKSF